MEHDPYIGRTIGSYCIEGKLREGKAWRGLKASPHEVRLLRPSCGMPLIDKRPSPNYPPGNVFRYLIPEDAL